MTAQEKVAEAIEAMRRGLRKVRVDPAVFRNLIPPR